MSSTKKSLLKNLLALGIGCVFAFLLLEIFLRIYNPFGFRVKGAKIILYPYKKYIVENSRIPGLPKKIIHTKNSLGFRGEEPPKNFARVCSIVAVSGSTTECCYLSDGTSWPEILGTNLKKDIPEAWVNNAGLDGQSTFGHMVLLSDYISKLKPRIVIYYVGLNDMGLSEMNDSDMAIMSSGNALKHLRNLLARRSEVFAAAYNFYLYFSSRKAALNHGAVNPETAEWKHLSAEEEENIVKAQKQYLDSYEKRVVSLIEKTREIGAEPVLLTQAVLCSGKKNEKTGKYLGKIASGNSFGNCETFGKCLNLYNETLKKVARDKKVFLVDMGEKMPPNSACYYDLFHFSEKGSEIFANILYEEIRNFIKKKCVTDGTH